MSGHAGRRGMTLSLGLVALGGCQSILGIEEGRPRACQDNCTGGQTSSAGGGAMGTAEGGNTGAGTTGQGGASLQGKGGTSSLGGGGAGEIGAGGTLMTSNGGKAEGGEAPSAGAGGALASGGSSSGGSAAGGRSSGGSAGTPAGGMKSGTGGSPGAGGTTATGGSPAGGKGGAAPLGGIGGGGTTGAGGGPPAVAVELNQEAQTIAGFGISNARASAAMSPADADALFHTTKGIGLSILSISMGANGDAFTGTATWADIGLAKERGVSTYMATVWSPPAAWKDSGSLYDGGHLLPNRYDSWGTTIAAFPGKVKAAAAVDLYAMSLQREVDFASCGLARPCDGTYPTTVFTADEYVDFVKVVGPKLRASSPQVKILGPEVSQWPRLWSNSTADGSTDPLGGQGYDYGHALHADPDAWELLDLFGVHQYVVQAAQPWPNDIPKKPLWQTEMGGAPWWPEEGPSSHINNGVAVAGWIHDALVNGNVSAWLWATYRPNADNNMGLLLNNGNDTKRRYTLGNYSKFVRPGYVRVNVTGPIPSDVLISAYKAADNTVVVVAINKGTSAVSFPLRFSGGTGPASLTPWLTSASDNLAAKTAVTPSNGSFTASLPSKTVTTFVGR